MMAIDKGIKSVNDFVHSKKNYSSWHQEYEDQQPSKRHRGQKQRNNDGWK